jgi:hypothetical protein
MSEQETQELLRAILARLDGQRPLSAVERAKAALRAEIEANGIPESEPSDWRPTPGTEWGDGAEKPKPWE